MRACVYRCVSDPRFIQFALDSCYAVHINALSNIIKGYIEMNNMQVELGLTRFRKKNSYF